MADDFTRAAEALRFNLLGLPLKLRKRAIRESLVEAAQPVRDAAQKAAPVLARATKYRKPGVLRKAIKVRISKRDEIAGDVGVFVNVKQLPGAKYRYEKSGLAHGKGRRILIRASKRGAKNPLDVFYWYFVFKGTKKMSGRDYLGAGAAKLSEALRIFERSLGDKIRRIANGGPV